MPKVRAASHAGSWYSSDRRKLALELDGWLDGVPNRVPLIRRAAAGGDGEREQGGNRKGTGDVTLPVTGANAIIAP